MEGGCSLETMTRWVLSGGSLLFSLRSDLLTVRHTWDAPVFQNGPVFLSK